MSKKGLTVVLILILATTLVSGFTVSDIPGWFSGWWSNFDGGSYAGNAFKGRDDLFRFPNNDCKRFCKKKGEFCDKLEGSRYFGCTTSQFQLDKLNPQLKCKQLAASIKKFTGQEARVYKNLAYCKNDRGCAAGIASRCKEVRLDTLFTNIPELVGARECFVCNPSKPSARMTAPVKAAPNSPVVQTPAASTPSQATPKPSAPKSDVQNEFVDFDKVVDKDYDFWFSSMKVQCANGVMESFADSRDCKSTRAWVSVAKDVCKFNCKGAQCAPLSFKVANKCRNKTPVEWELDDSSAPMTNTFGNYYFSSLLTCNDGEQHPVGELDCKAGWQWYKYAKDVCASSNSNDKGVSSWTVGSSCDPNAPKPAKCTDSDNGKNYATNGYAKGIDSNTLKEATTTDYCSGNILYESYCGFSSRVGDNAVMTEEYTCEYGCANGACNPKPACTPSCTGKYVPDPIDDYVSSVNDYCQSTTWSDGCGGTCRGTQTRKDGAWGPWYDFAQRGYGSPAGTCRRYGGMQGLGVRYDRQCLAPDGSSAPRCGGTRCVGSSSRVDPCVVNNPPVIVSSASNRVQVGSQYQYYFRASDSDGPGPYTYSLTRGPSGMYMQSSATQGIVYWRPTSAQIGYHQATFSVSDGEDSVSQTVSIQVTMPPVVTPTYVPPTYTYPRYATPPAPTGKACGQICAHGGECASSAPHCVGFSPYARCSKQMFRQTCF